MLLLHQTTSRMHRGFPKRDLVCILMLPFEFLYSDYVPPKINTYIAIEVFVWMHVNILVRSSDETRRWSLVHFS